MPRTPRQRRSVAWTPREEALLARCAEMDRCPVSEVIREGALSYARRRLQRLQRQRPFTPKPLPEPEPPAQGPY